MKKLPTTVFLLVFATACTRIRPEATLRSPQTRDAYEDGLLRSKIGQGEAYRDWSDAARRALRDRLSIRPSFKEVVYFSPDRATAVGYRLMLHRGQRLRLDVERHTKARVFAEIFEEIGPGEPVFRLVESASATQSHVEFEARTDGPHVVRLQPELFKGGEVVVVITTAASLTFPVEGKSKRAIGSFFGDSRDGGKRDHEGIDIFATAGTPVIAVADGVVTTVNTTSLGGNVVWQEDPARGVTYYYAHLKKQLVARGQHVRAGDAVGLVGNTGNARTTPSHLHFGVYKPGRVALDPVPFLFDQPSDPISPVLVDLSVLGQTRALSNEAKMRQSPTPDAPTLLRPTPQRSVLILAGVRDWYRVLLEDGREGYIAARDLDSGYSVKGSH